jgi:hypothetical protein
MKNTPLEVFYIFHILHIINLLADYKIANFVSYAAMFHLKYSFWGIDSYHFRVFICPNF